MNQSNDHNPTPLGDSPSFKEILLTDPYSNLITLQGDMLNPMPMHQEVELTSSSMHENRLEEPVREGYCVSLSPDDLRRIYHP